MQGERGACEGWVISDRVEQGWEVVTPCDAEDTQLYSSLYVDLAGGVMGLGSEA